MGEVRPIPTLGGLFGDVRGQGRALRVSWHEEAGLVVLSLWHGPRCTGTVRVASADVPQLLEALAAGYRRPWQDDLGRVVGNRWPADERTVEIPPLAVAPGPGPRVEDGRTVEIPPLAVAPEPRPRIEDGPPVP